MFIGEHGYLRLIRNILKVGDKRKTRNGNMYSLFGTQLHFSLRDNTLPVLTTKKMAIRSCIEELLWFMNGDINVRTLQNKNVRIWDKNAVDLEKRIGRPLHGDMGPIYGYQWRNFNGQGVDQLEEIIFALRDPKERFSRRLILSVWNPCQIHEMALPPCHVLAQFHVNSNNMLSCQVYQRSGDMGLGVPFNILSYATLTHILAKHTNLEANQLVLTLGDAHIYNNHIEGITEQLRRTPYNFPWVVINRKKKIEDYTYKDIIIQNYKHHPRISLDMTV
jgi:thymidylate synthase